MIGTSLNCINCENACIKELFEKETIIFFKSCVRQVHYRKGETILKQGTFADNILFLRKGLVKLILESNTGKETIFKLASTNSFVGLSVLFAGDFVPFSVVALKDCDVCFIKKELMEEQLLGSKIATEFVLTSYNKESLFLLKKISVISTRNNHGKLAEALIYTASQELKDEKATQFLTRNDWADLASISLESTNKILSELKNDLIIKITNEGLEICKIDLLLRLSRIG
jgi:CRP/FNR family transcriptional regulator